MKCAVYEEFELVGDRLLTKMSNSIVFEILKMHGL